MASVVGNNMGQRCQSLSSRKHRAPPASAARFSGQRRDLVLIGKGAGSHDLLVGGLERRATSQVCLASSLAPITTGNAARNRCDQQANISTAWLNNMVPNLVKKLNKSQQGSGSRGGSGRGDGGVTMAFVCNEVMQEPLTEVDRTTGDESFEDWNVIMGQVDAMEVEGLAGILVVKPLTDRKELSCPAARKRKARALAKIEHQGRVGECCHGEGEEGDNFVNESLDFSFDEDFSVDEVANSNSSSDSVKRSYGVVLQSSERNATVDGCYILNTSTSSSLGCACTHYSMSRALCGSDGKCMTVEQQVDSAWLVNPF